MRKLLKQWTAIVCTISLLLLNLMPVAAFSEEELDPVTEPAPVIEMTREAEEEQPVVQNEEPTEAETVVEEPETKEPETEEPVIEEPETKEPEAEEPVIEEPETKEPETKEPETEEPVIEEPETKEPETEEPVIEEPETKEPEAKEPVIEEPETKEPVIEEPETEEPVIEEPETKEPETKEQVTEEQVVEEQVTEKQEVEEHVTEEPVAEEPVTGENDGEDILEDYETALGMDTLQTIVIEEETGINVREGAYGLAAIFTSLPANAEVTVVRRDGDWVTVVFNGELGYIYIDDIADYLEALEEEPDEETVEIPKKVTIFTSRRTVMEEGEPVLLTSKLEGFEDCEEVLYIWKVDKGDGFEVIEGANESTYTFTATMESLAWDWHLTVLYR